VVASENTDQLRDWVGLSMAHGVGPASFFALVRRFGSPTRVLDAPVSALRKYTALKAGTVAELADPERLRRRADDELVAIARVGGRILIHGHDDYPEGLGHISQPPPVVYILGKQEVLQLECVAMVGSRAATSYGRRVARRIAADLAALGVCVVSGLALGIDGEAHGGALGVGGSTAAVLGCGLDVVYPRTNRRLYEQIRAEGLLVSEYPLATPPEPFRFPARNRIIAGLSRGIVVVEASRKSGSLITVQHGLEAGREIFAVPGQVDSAKSAGTHWLVQQGAPLIVSADDIVEHLSLKPAVCRDVSTSSGAALSGLDREAAALLALIEPYPRPREELLQASEFSAARLQELLLLLELERLVELLPGDQVRRITMT
jgi:DNA processing protein